MLESQEQTAGHDIVTLDQLCFQRSTGYESIWLPRGEKIPERPGAIIPCAKLIVIVAWPARAFHLRGVLASECKFNTGGYRKQMFEPLSDWQCEYGDNSNRKLINDADNPYTHTAMASRDLMETRGLESVIHPSYPPDLAPSEFYLSIHVKNFLSGP
jgi:hypothetical protein